MCLPWNFEKLILLIASGGPLHCKSRHSSRSTAETFPAHFTGRLGKDCVSRKVIIACRRRNFSYSSFQADCCFADNVGVATVRAGLRNGRSAINVPRWSLRRSRINYEPAIAVHHAENLANGSPVADIPFAIMRH